MGVLPAVLAAGMLLAATGSATAAIQSTKLKVVGTWGNLTNYFGFEEPFYKKTLEKASGGKIKATVNPITELGLKGWEVMRLLKLGVFDVSHGVYGYVASEDPALEGVDLSSAVKDLTEAKKLVAAYTPVISKHFNDTFNAKYLYSFPYPSQYIWCNADVNSLKDLKGKKIRVYSTTLGDFVRGVGGTSVTIAFAEVVPALQKGVADCGITGTMPAFQAKWHEVITHAIMIPVGTGMGFAAISNKKWKSFNKDTQDFLTAQYAKLEQGEWTNAQAEDADALRCLSGNGECKMGGETGHVKLVKPNAADYAERKRILHDYVLKAWAARCSEQCVKDWNATAAKIVGVDAVK